MSIISRDRWLIQVPEGLYEAALALIRVLEELPGNESKLESPEKLRSCRVNSSLGGVARQRVQARIARNIAASPSRDSLKDSVIQIMEEGFA